MKKLRVLSLGLAGLLVVASFLPAYAFYRTKFAVVSDPHISWPEEDVKDGFKLGKKSIPLLENTVAELNKIPDLDFVLVPGDLTQDAEPFNVDELRRILDELKVPYYVILGNHDVSPVAKPRKFPGPPPLRGVSKYEFVFAFQGHGFKGPKSYYSLDPLPGLHLVGLDTSKIGTWGGTVSPVQLRWLEDDLALNQDKFIIVQAHHNLTHWHKDELTDYKDYGNFLVDNAEEVRKIFENYGVKLVFSGHRHISTRYKEINGVYYFVFPSTCTYPMRYTVCELTPTTLSWQTKNVPAPSEWWELAKKNALGPAGKWWRCSDHPETPQGNEKMLKFFEAPETMSGMITFKRLSGLLVSVN